MQTNDPNNPAVAQISRDLTSKLLERARQSELAGKPTAADPDLTLASRYGASANDIQAIKQTVPMPKPATVGSGSRSAPAS